MADAFPDYFSLFQLEPRVDLDVAALNRCYRQIQQEIHPDRYAGKAAHEQRVAVQQASYVNEAYRCLSQPLSRAQYLLVLSRPDLAENRAMLDSSFLMEQMDLREQLETLVRSQAPVAGLEALTRQVSQACLQRQLRFQQEVERSDWSAAHTTLAEWQFLDKMRSEAGQALAHHD